MDTIGERIRAVRDSFDISQRAFGAKIGVSQTTLTALENDKNEPSMGTFNKIVEVFRVNPEWLRVGKGEMKPNEATLPTDPAAPSITAGPLQVVGETETEKALKRENQWLREQLDLWQKIATSGIDLSKVATGTHGSFSMGNDEADKLRAMMRAA